jgi:phosphatidylinositol glycan class Q protein
MHQKLSLYRQNSPKIISNGNLEEILKKINSVKPSKPTLTYATKLLQTRIIKGMLNYPLKFIQLLQLIIVRLNLERYSHTAQQLNLRIQQFQFWPAQYYEWQKSKLKLSPNSQAQYIGFFNTVWLIVNDIILGFAIKKSLIENNQEISKIISDLLIKTTIIRLNLVIDWLMRWPAGLKLNSELAVFLANLFQWMLSTWQIVLVQAVLYLPLIIYIIGCSGVFGATFTVSLLSDLLNFLTIHVKLLYIISARIFNWNILIIDSTWNLFRGRKRNPLRNRIDSAVYDLDQLLLGAIIFTLLVFLLPTVGVFYLLFCFVLYISLGYY